MYKLCKTNQSIDRQQQIASRLVELLEEQPYAEITVSGLCRECYISRNVFYKYFDSIDAVLDFIGDKLALDFEKYISQNTAEMTYVEEGARFFRYWYQQRDVLDIIIENNLLEVIFARIVLKLTENQVGANQLPDEMPEKYYSWVVHFALYGLAAMLTKWHNENYKTSPEELAEASVYLLTNPIFGMRKE